MKKLFLIVVTVFLNITLFSCSTSGDDEVYLENPIEVATDDEGPILPPPPPPPGGNGGG